MDFAFPDIKASCPICGEKGCAIWKGYYPRRVLCVKYKINEKVAIHVGRCQNKKKDFSFFPKILIPYVRVTRPTLGRLFKAWLKLTNVAEASESVTQEFSDDEWILPFSTAWSWLYLVLVFCRLNFAKLSTPSSHRFGNVNDLLIFRNHRHPDFMDSMTNWPGYTCPKAQPP